jgi:hypothetical protein
MSDAEEGKIAQAAYAGSEQIVTLLHDPSPEVVKALLGNSSLREEDVLAIANRKNLPASVLDMIGRDKRWTESYPIRLALARNPKTPISISLSIVRYLHLFDIAEMTRSHLLPLPFRHKVESIVMERIPTMPLGNKKALAKMVAGNVLFRLLQDDEDEVIALCLANPRMQESHLFKFISRKDTRAETIRMIAGHQNWSGRPLVRYALVRNEHTPLAISERFLQTMKVLELRELHADPTLPPEARPLVYRELLSRGQDPGDRIEEQVFEVDENDDESLENFTEDKEQENPEALI